MDNNNDINTGEINKVKADNLIGEERVLSDEEMDKLFKLLLRSTDITFTIHRELTIHS